MGRSPSLCAMTTTPPARAPIVERVAGWSARHRKTAVFGWLLLVVAAVVIGQRLGTDNLNSYDPGQAGQAERVLDRPVVQLPDSESVLVQGPARAPIVERVAGWSARHRKTAVFGWLLLVVAAVVIGQRLGTDNLNSYDPGQAGQAER